jgi:nucleotidyltransferase substrate binding protein (TIGR01987 family)
VKEIPLMNLSELSQLEREGVIQRFEFALELAWKTLKDKMEFDGILIDKISPKMVLKDAYRAKYIDDIELWIQMINDRNLLSHNYDYEKMEKIIPAIQSKYAPIMIDLFNSLAKLEN